VEAWCAVLGQTPYLHKYAAKYLCSVRILAYCTPGKQTPGFGTTVRGREDVFVLRQEEYRYSFFIFLNAAIIATQVKH